MYEKVAIEGKPDWCEIGVKVEVSDDGETWMGSYPLSGFDSNAIAKYPFYAGSDWWRYARPVTKWQPKEGEAVMAWEDEDEYFFVKPFFTDDIQGDHIAKYDGRLDLRVSQIGPEVPRLK